MADKKQDSGRASLEVGGRRLQRTIAHTRQRRGSVQTFYDNYKLTLGQEIALKHLSLQKKSL